MILSSRNSLYLLALLFAFSAWAIPPKKYTKYDYLHGKLNANRSWFDVTMYDITLKVIPKQKYILGSNTIFYKVLKSNKIMQLDLQQNMHVDSVVYENSKLKFTRDSSVVKITIPKQTQSSINKLTVYFSGYPVIAKKAPWDGGFVFTKDTNGFDWVGLACQGIGASIWLPCKDHLSDEADSVNVHLQVPENLTGVSNGKLISQQHVGNGYRQFNWQVRYPINNYNITVNVGNYAVFTDEYKAVYHQLETPLQLSYYVLKHNLTQAKTHFKQVVDMMQCFEKYFGTYPFWNDGYKLVETPYWGMEHQSAVSYGNNYENNRWSFDFIIIHESAHEWFGNSISASDPADLWIHESFTTHAEAIFVECMWGRETAVKYLKMQKRNIENNKSMFGDKDVYFHQFADNDIYYKGSWILFTLRNVIDNDTLWFNTLKAFCEGNKLKLINTKAVIDFFNKRTRKNLTPFFIHYLGKATLPVFEYSIKADENGSLAMRYRWSNVDKNFDMPIKVILTKDIYEPLSPLAEWRVIDLNYLNKSEFKILADSYLIDVKETPWK